MKINIGKLLGAALKVVKSNPTLVLGAVSIGKEIVKAVKDEAKKTPTPRA
ncbi:hypothetical protein Q5H91_04205 [Sphingomonas sp. KR1UV-12]|uniref:Uncharacterized protein n=1 Tax=Sphingomonas aurea TaxID=3063994 RepID=A0ABT9EHU2_9SPHN|nr:hypothetical protein [Sphingomonas sp. KR1UV-12]MDP1026405.1 hypothetical protein [Sphingomonas sp. KR1UV-12]